MRMKQWLSLLTLSIVGCGVTIGVRADEGVNTAAVGEFAPSPYGRGKLPDGFLIQAKGRPEVYVIRGGKKSLIYRPILDRWLTEAHYFKHDVIVTLSPAELATYRDAPARNAFSMGRILTVEGKKKFFIDDRLRRRPISPAVQAALKYPSRNVYKVPASIVNEFPVGPAVTRTDRHPGGTVLYRGAYHGGVVYLIRGDDTKHEFLHDYAYETMGFPWSSQILPVSPEELARYKRGAHVSTYPDGWVVGKGSRVYVTQSGKLRWIASNELFRALKYNPKYILRVFPEFFRNYEPGDPVTAFKDVSVTVSEDAVRTAQQIATGRTAGTSAEGVTASLRVPQRVRQLIASVNALFLSVYDRNPTASENKFWVDYLYKGEAQTEEEFLAALKETKGSGERPTITSRTAVLEPEKLLGYVNFLFYYVHGRFPDEGEKAYWDERVRSGIRKTIEDLGGNIQYLKDQGFTKR